MNLPIQLSRDQLSDLLTVMRDNEWLCGAAELDLDDRLGKRFAVKLCLASNPSVFRWLIWDVGQDGAGKSRCMWHQLREELCLSLKRLC